MNTLTAVAQAIEHAKGKHPEKTADVLPVCHEEHVLVVLARGGIIARHQNDYDSPDAVSVLREELGEFADAVIAGDWQGAYDEMVQCAAVCLMIAAGIEQRGGL